MRILNRTTGILYILLGHGKLLQAEVIIIIRIHMPVSTTLQTTCLESHPYDVFAQNQPSFPGDGTREGLQPL